MSAPLAGACVRRKSHPMRAPRGLLQVRQRMAMDGVDPAPLDALAATSAMP